MKKSYIFLLFVCSSFVLKAQQGEVPTGGTATGTGGTASYSIGQVTYHSVTGGGNTVAEGLQQPYEISVVTGTANSEIQLQYSVYPNPSRDQVTLTVEDVKPGDLSFSVFDAQGKLLLQRDIQSASTQIPMEDLNNGMYYIHLLKNKKEVKSFKVIKNK